MTSLGAATANTANVALIPVPRLWPDSTIAVIAAGPSLMLPDVDYVRGRVTATIAVNESWRMAPWADVLYGCDADKFWRWNKGVPDFHGLKYTMRKGNHLAQKVAAQYGLAQLRNAGDKGLSLDPSALCTGQNSGYQAINLGFLLGARRIILLGLDMQTGDNGKRRHWHKNHPDGSQPPYRLCLSLFHTIVEPLKVQGIEVINCSARTALTAFPCRPLRDALP